MGLKGITQGRPFACNACRFNSTLEYIWIGPSVLISSTCLCKEYWFLFNDRLNKVAGVSGIQNWPMIPDTCSML